MIATLTFDRDIPDDIDQLKMALNASVVQDMIESLYSELKVIEARREDTFNGVRYKDPYDLAAMIREYIQENCLYEYK